MLPKKALTKNVAIFNVLELKKSLIYSVNATLPGHGQDKVTEVSSCIFIKFLFPDLKQQQKTAWRKRMP